MNVKTYIPIHPTTRNRRRGMPIKTRLLILAAAASAVFCVIKTKEWLG